MAGQEHGATKLQQLLEAIVREHRDEPHPEVDEGALKAHLLIHGMVEKQLLENDPPETRQALDQLMRQGLERHQAVHLVGEVVAREAMAMIEKKRPMNREAYVKALRALNAASTLKRR